MSLSELITEIENETWKITEDTDLTTVIKIKEELAACEQNEARAALFNDARQLADVIIQKYLSLDQEDRQRMAEAYESEECFEKNGGMPHGTRKRLNKILINKNLLLLQQISSYSKIIPILENYIHYTENTSRIKVANSTLTYFLHNHNLTGKKVRKGSLSSLINLCNYNYINNRELSRKGVEITFKSLTHGVPEDLKQKVRDAMSLLPVRKKILEKYVHYVETNPDIKVRNSTLAYYLYNHKLSGEGVEDLKDSMISFYNWDFANNRTANEKSIQATFKSLTHGVPEDLKQRVRDAISLLPVRRRILENYVHYVENTPNIKVSTSTLTYYLYNHNLNGKEVENFSDSLVSFYNYYCVNGKLMSKKRNEAIFKSLTHGVPEDLKQKVRDAMSLLPVRKKILEKYVHYVENTSDIKVGNSTLAYYLYNHNLNGKEVENSKDSLESFYIYDFVKKRRVDKRSCEAAFKSLTHGVPEDLKQRVRDAMSLLPVRKKILEKYVHYVENTPDIKVRNSGLSYYLISHNLQGDPVRTNSEFSLASYRAYDFANNCRTNKKSSKATFKSLTRSIKDQELVRKVRLYNSRRMAA